MSYYAYNRWCACILHYTVQYLPNQYDYGESVTIISGETKNDVERSTVHGPSVYMYYMKVNVRFVNGVVGNSLL